MSLLHYSRSNLIVSDTPGLSTLADTDANKKVVANSLRELVPGMTTPIETDSIQDELLTNSSSDIPNTDANKKVIADAIREQIPGMTTPIEEGSIQEELTANVEDVQEDLTEVLENTAKVSFTKP